MAHLHCPSVIIYQMRLLPYAHSNTYHLRLCLNCSLVSVLHKSCGSLFQLVGPHTRKLRLPNRVDRTRGMTGYPLSTDCSLERAATVCTGVYTSPKYSGHRLRKQSNIISAILKVMHCDIGSQWRVSCDVRIASDAIDRTDRSRRMIPSVTP